MSSSGTGSIERLLGRAKPLAVLLLAGLVAASVSACVATPSRSATAGPASPRAAASGSPIDNPLPVETASPTLAVTPAPPGDTIAWTQLLSDSLPPVETSTNDVDMPNGILEGWHGGYVEFVWHPETYLLTPWTSTDGRAWTAGTSINAGLIWKSQLATFLSDANQSVDLLGCSFQSTGWADDGQALLFRGRLNCQLGCASYWESGETVLISTNGAAWADIDETKVFGAGGLGPVSGGGSGFAGLGFVTDKQVLWTSQDGLTWQRRALPSLLTQAGASVADPASIDGAMVLPGVRLDSGTPFGSASGNAPGAGVYDCDATTSNAPPPVYTPALYASSDEGSHWTAVTLPGAVKAIDVSLSLVRVDDHTLIVIEWYQTDSGPIWLYWISSDGSNWKPASLAALATFPFPTPLPANEGGLLFSTQYCPPTGYCSNVLSLYALSEDGQVVTLDQIGDIPAVGIETEVALGPAGVLVSDGGSNLWLGTRS
jgi:hypothetical protein